MGCWLSSPLLMYPYLHQTTWVSAAFGWQRLARKPGLPRSAPKWRRECPLPNTFAQNIDAHFGRLADWGLELYVRLEGFQCSVGSMLRSPWFRQSRMGVSDSKVSADPKDPSLAVGAGRAGHAARVKSLEALLPQYAPHVVLSTKFEVPWLDAWNGFGRPEIGNRDPKEFVW